MVIYHQKIIFNDLLTPSDYSSVLLKAENWKGFVTQSLGQFAFSTLTARFWIPPLFRVLAFFYLAECTIVKLRWVRGGSFFGKGEKAAVKGAVEREQLGSMVPPQRHSSLCLGCLAGGVPYRSWREHQHALRILEASSEELTIWKLFL